MMIVIGASSCHLRRMINETALLTIDPANAAAFEAAVEEAAPLFRAAPGCHGLALERGIEEPGQYRLRVQWESVSHHMDLFRNSDAFAQWRALVGPYFTGPAVMDHSETVKQYF
jgi:quinol monooxygenase YgiN